jgi:ATP-dependent 26S proteasome regulatory subunit
MRGSNGGYIPQNYSDNAIHQHQAMNQNFAQRQHQQHLRQQHQQQQQQQQQQQHQQEQRQHQHDNSGSNRQGTNIGSPVSFNKDDEALRLLQQLAAEQSELLDRLHVVNPSALAASAVIVRPTEQYLTIALNGKNTDLIGLQHLVSCIFAMSVLSHNIEYSAQ